MVINARASGERRPVRSVLAPPRRRHPPPRPRGVHGDAGGAQRIEVTASGSLADLQLVGHLTRGHVAAGLKEQQRGHESVGADVDRTSQGTGHQVATSGFRTGPWGSFPGAAVIGVDAAATLVHTWGLAVSVGLTLNWPDADTDVTPAER